MRCDTFVQQASATVEQTRADATLPVLLCPQRSPWVGCATAARQVLVVRQVDITSTVETERSWSSATDVCIRALELIFPRHGG
jgi:hypothetical protein